MKICSFFFLLMLALAQTAFAGSSLDFTTHKLGDNTQTVLVIGGIQGDEPGGFSAASLLATRYTVTKGAVWVVPNLNFPAIVKRSRGLHGDMNRKFASLDRRDPEYATVMRIQEIILNPKVDLVLNLHDGSGFFRPEHQSTLYSPARWGQCVIIDKARVEIPFGNLEQTAHSVTSNVNASLLHPQHHMYVKNTLTDEGNQEMLKSLSWFAVRNGKAAFGVEASKDLNTEERAYYHLRVIEAFLTQKGIEFTRNFELSPRGVRMALQENIQIAFLNNRFVLPLENARPSIAGQIPIPREAVRSATGNMPILAVLESKNELQVQYGNRTLTRMKPDWCESYDGLEQLNVMVDGALQTIRFGDTVTVKEHFSVKKTDGFRINAIGMDSSHADESGLLIRKQDFLPRFSLDTQATLYRIEAYKDKRFVGMFVVRFGEKKELMARTNPTSIKNAVESDLGR